MKFRPKHEVSPDSKIFAQNSTISRKLQMFKTPFYHIHLQRTHKLPNRLEGQISTTIKHFTFKQSNYVQILKFGSKHPQSQKAYI